MNSSSEVHPRAFAAYWEKTLDYDLENDFSDIIPEIPSEIMELSFPELIIPLEIESSQIDWPKALIFCISEFT